MEVMCGCEDNPHAHEWLTPTPVIHTHYDLPEWVSVRYGNRTKQRRKLESVVEGGKEVEERNGEMLESRGEWEWESGKKQRGVGMEIWE